MRPARADEPTGSPAAGKIGDFKIALAEWSIHKALFNKDISIREFGRAVTHLDFPRIAREEFGIDAVEYVNQFFHDKAHDANYLGSLRRMAGDAGVTCVLIRVDGEGDLSTRDPDERAEALINHKKWIDAAAVLGCRAVRVNTGHHFRTDELWPVDEMGMKLADYGRRSGIDVLCENQTGPSSHPETMLALMKAVNRSNFGMLIDFGNFPHHAGKFRIDIYDAIARLMPHARALSAQSLDFDGEGRETRLDYARILKIVTDAGYHGHIAIEYQGDRRHFSLIPTVLRRPVMRLVASGAASTSRDRAVPHPPLSAHRFGSPAPDPTTGPGGAPGTRRSAAASATCTGPSPGASACG
jgi:sugar phosphate isomerase/epimerase